MRCYVFGMYLTDSPLRRSGVLIIFLLNVCFNILQEISNAKGEKEGGKEG